MIVQRINPEKGWTPEHDDQHEIGAMAVAGACYAGQAFAEGEAKYRRHRITLSWPWSFDWWKPTTPRRDLVKAAALLLAEIERLDRAAKQECGA